MVFSFICVLQFPLCSVWLLGGLICVYVLLFRIRASHHILDNDGLDDI